MVAIEFQGEDNIHKIGIIIVICVKGCEKKNMRVQKVGKEILRKLFLAGSGDNKSTRYDRKCLQETNINKTLACIGKWQ